MAIIPSKDPPASSANRSNVQDDKMNLIFIANMFLNRIKYGEDDDSHHVAQQINNIKRPWYYFNILEYFRRNSNYRQRPKEYIV